MTKDSSSEVDVSRRIFKAWAASAGLKCLWRQPDSLPKLKGRACSAAVHSGLLYSFQICSLRVGDVGRLGVSDYRCLSNVARFGQSGRVSSVDIRHLILLPALRMN